MSDYTLRIELESDTVFGSGSGMNSQIDIEVQHDQYGCPFLGGRALKGILQDECANILYSLARQGRLAEWKNVARRIFGFSGSGYDAETAISFSNAELPQKLHAAIINEVKIGRVSAEEVLNSITAIRYQTAVDYKTGAARDKSLRSKRVIIRKTPFESHLKIDENSFEEKMFLAACVKAFRRAGTGRNRGTGELTAKLLFGEEKMDITETFYEMFKARVKEVTP